jgi:chromate transporter
MKKDIRFYIKLFLSTFYLSAFTFGGGYVIIPLMRKKFVNEYHWIDENEMLDLTAIAQATPGAMAVNAAILVGYRLAGIFGSLITILGTVLPPLIILSLISFAYTSFINNPVIKLLLRGMQAGIAAVIIDVVISMVFSLVKEGKRLPVIIMIGAFIASFILDINIIIIIITSGLISVAGMFYFKHIKKSGEIK